MRMRASEGWHDVYPKANLDGNYIGDGYPLCADILPRSFLAKGAHYTFLGESYSGSYVKELSQDSALYNALCQSGSPSSCSFSLSHELQDDLACYNEECNMDTVEVVKVGNGYFEYEPPTCVHLYFANGQKSVMARRYNAEVKQVCENPDMLVAGISCCGTVEGVFQETRMCGQPAERVRFSVAEAACASRGLSICTQKTAPASCGLDDLQIWMPSSFNCSTQIEIDAYGKVSAQTDDKTKANQFAVQWANGFPKASDCPSDCTSGDGTCTCDVIVSTKMVFAHTPTKEEVKTNLTIGAHAPRVPCDVCSGDVKVYHVSGAFDENTIFESEGHYYKNMQSIGSAGGFEFRNPPAFMSPKYPTQRAALAEVEALLDHLFHHPNTPVFVSYRLIQRFGNSNPSSQYLMDVAEAFKTGVYNGIIYSNQYGDLSATIAAILLHPEARNPHAETPGSLREPLIKIVHYLRSMEYVDSNHSEVMLFKLEDVIGQEPYQSPSVSIITNQSISQLPSQVM
jgi:hypothetical protein